MEKTIAGLMEIKKQLPTMNCFACKKIQQKKAGR
jgi:hypothetical protein